MGWQIFLHSVRQVIGNMDAALRISGALFLVQVVVSYAMGVSLSGDRAAMEQRMVAGDFPWLGMILAIAVTLATGMWIAVAWHRYVLKVEKPTTLIPPFHGDRILGYLGKSILLIIIAIPIALVASFIVGFVFSAFYTTGQMPGMGLGILAGIIVMLPVIVVIYRMSVILPGSALGQPLGLREAWSKTAGSSGAIVFLAVLSIVAAIAIDLPLMLMGSVPLLGFVWATATAWLKMMVGISILTTLYGHFVEGRALV